MGADLGGAAPDGAVGERTAGPPAAPGMPRRSGRIGGLDLARGAAILGMFMVHIGPNDVGGVAGRLYATPHGRASILFGLVAGVGVSLLAGSRTTSPASARLKLAWRAAVLLPVGLVLQELDHGVLVILQDYAVLFLLAILVVTLGDRWLLGLAGATAVIGPVLFLWGEINQPAAFTRAAITLADDPGEIVHGLVLSGPYPLITWGAPFLLGMWLGRRDLRARALRLRLIVAGGGVAVLAIAASVALTAVLGDPGEPSGWGKLIVDNPHSQMPLWLVGSTGSAVLVLGAALVVADAANRLLWPLITVGQLALTLYVGHLLALHAASEALTSDDVGEAVLLVAAFTLAAAAFATTWRAAFSRGPLEALLNAPWRAARERRADTGSENPRTVTAGLRGAEQGRLPVSGDPPSPGSGGRSARD